MNSTSQYVLPFGKYKGMYAVDVAEITVVDKAGNDKNVGLTYLEWLTKQAWFRDAEVIEKIIHNARNNMSDADDEEPAPPPKPQKKELKPKKGTVKITQNQTLDMNA